MSRVALVTGANRGLGLELVRQLATDGAAVVATCRTPGTATDLTAVAADFPGQVRILPLDVADASSRAALDEALGDTAIDELWNNAGVSGRFSGFGQMDADKWLQVLATNTVAPLVLTQLLTPRLERGAGKKVAMVTSRMGSIADNTSGGSYSYRSSKAALNAASRSLALDLGERGIHVAILHPGWVQTDMGGPRALIDVATSVRGMREQVAALNAERSGLFTAFDGRELPW